MVVRAAAVDVASKLSAEDVASWESCKSLVMDLGLDEENAERSLVKAFGWGPQNYWRKSKVEEVPSVDDVEARLDYLVEIGIPREKIVDIVFKVPEVIGCELEAHPGQRGAHREGVLHEAQDQELRQLHPPRAAGVG